MPAEESKQISTSADPAPSDQPSDKALGKQAAVESDDDDDAGADEAAAAPGSAPTTASGKKKKSKRKKVKDALTGKASDPQADIKKAISGLTPQQMTELLALNPALAQELGATAGEGGAGSAASPSPEKLADAVKKLNLQEIMTGLAASGKNVKDMGAYRFWQTQPVPKFGETEAQPDGPLKVQTVEDVPKELPALVEGFEWVEVDVTDDNELKEVWELLNGHYVEDDEAMFRFNYSASILRWALMAPGWRKEWHVGVRASTSRKLVAFISATPATIRVRQNSFRVSEVNFLCVHKKLRNKRLAPVLIKEITRRSNLHEIWQGLYTAGIVLPKPVSTCRYFHRAINWQKLYECGFSPLPPNSKPQYQVRKYALPDQPALRGWREIQTKDIEAVMNLMERYEARFEMAPTFDKDEFEHWFFHKKDSGEQVVWTYVVEDENKKITDFISWYCVESSVINSTRHQNVRAAYMFYYATESAFGTPYDRSAHKSRLNVLVNDALIVSKRYKFDVFNALSLMDNALFLEQQKFGAGDGQLHFYLFNYRASPIAGGVNKKNQLDDDNLSGIGVVML